MAWDSNVRKGREELKIDTYYIGRSLSSSSVSNQLFLFTIASGRVKVTYPSLRSSLHLSQAGIISGIAADTQMKDALYIVSPTQRPNNVCFPCSSSARSTGHSFACAEFDERSAVEKSAYREL